MTQQNTREKAMLDEVAAFAQRVVAPEAPRWERERKVDMRAFREAAALGLTAIEVPADHGGLGLSFGCKARATGLLAAADFGFAMSVVNSQNVAAKLPGLASDRIVAQYVPGLVRGDLVGCTALTEPGAGSDFAAITTTATRTDTGWRVNGRKAWIVNAAFADVVFAYVQTEPGSGARGIAAFVIAADRAGFVRDDAYALSGQHTIGTAGFTLSDYELSDDEMMLPPGEAFVQALVGINGARTYVAAMCCAMVGEALRIVAAYGRERTTFGKPLVQHQGWRWALAQAEVDLEAGLALTRAAADAIDAGEDAQSLAARAKVFATRMAERHIPALSQCMGAEGLRESYPFGRHLLGAKVAGFVDGSTEILLERIARNYMR